ncbi:MAG: response regulator transcription factor [Phenylobacterium sp.]|nr:response regulator transcription factor [Phenylobacterium sp.]
MKMHLHNLYEKLGVSSRTELAILARDRGIG